MDPKRFAPTRLCYDEVPFYRRRWFLLLTMLFLLPATIAIPLTGEIYAQSKGKVYRFLPAGKNQVIFAAATFMVVGLLVMSR
ncbi:hypothetical protein [Pseudomonas sp. Marseille-QA0892]